MSIARSSVTESILRIVHFTGYPTKLKALPNLRFACTRIPQNLAPPEGQDCPAFCLQRISLSRVASKRIHVSVIRKAIAVDRNLALEIGKIGNREQLAGARARTPLEK